MSVVSIQDYRDITEDQATPDDVIQTRLTRAEGRVTEYLGRIGLELGTYSEDLPADCARSLLHPTVTPIQSVLAPVNARVIDGVAVSTETGWPWDMIIEGEWDWIYPTRHRVTVTYVGGWTNETLPQNLREAIVLVASRLAAPTGMATQVPVGATQVKLGDASLTFGRPFGSGGSIEALVPGMSTVLRMYKYRY